MTEIIIQSLADVVKANKQVLAADSTLRFSPCDIGADGKPCINRSTDNNTPCKVFGAMQQTETGMECLIQQAPITIVDLRVTASKRS